MYPVYCCSHYPNIVSNSLLLLDGKVKCLKMCGHEIYLDLANNAYIADANFHYTECGMAKLLHEYC